MPKITIADLESKLAEAEKQRQELSAKQLQAQIESKRAAGEAEKCATAGDIQGYMAAMKKKAEAEAAAYVAEAQLKNFTGELSREEILAAWNSFRSDYDSEMLKLEKELERIRGDFAKTFEKMVDKQNAAFEQREKIAKLMGISITAIDPGEPALSDLPMSFIEVEKKSPVLRPVLTYNLINFCADAAYYAALKNYEANGPEIQRLVSIIRNHRFSSASS